MTRAFLRCTVVLVLAMAAAIAPATAQLPPPPPTFAPPANAPPRAGTPKKKPTPPGPNIAGNWSGQLTPYRRLRHPIEKVARGAECIGAIKALRRSASRCHWSRLSMMRSITAQWKFSIAHNRSSSIRNSFSSRRIVGTGSDASGNCGAGNQEPPAKLVV